jgi:hypothetical protein
MCVVVKFSLQSSTHVLQWLWWMFYILVVSNYVFKRYVQDLGGLNHDLLYVLGLKVFCTRTILIKMKLAITRLLEVWIKIFITTWRFMLWVCFAFSWIFLRKWKKWLYSMSFVYYGWNVEGKNVEYWMKD